MSRDQRSSLCAALRERAESAREFDEKGVHGAVWSFLPYAEILALIDVAEAARSVYAGLTCAQDPMDVDERIELLGEALSRV